MTLSSVTVGSSGCTIDGRGDAADAMGGRSIVWSPSCTHALPRYKEVRPSRLKAQYSGVGP